MPTQLDSETSCASVIEVRPVRPEDHDAWEEIAMSSDDAWLSHSWDWNVAIEEGVMGGERRSLVVLLDRRLVGIVPQHLHTRRRGLFVQRVLYANYWAGGGVALANEVVGTARVQCFAAARRATHEQARRNHVDKLVVFLPPLARRNLRGDPEARRALDGGFVDRSSSYRNSARSNRCTRCTCTRAGARAHSPIPLSTSRRPSRVATSRCFSPCSRERPSAR